MCVWVISHKKKNAASHKRDYNRTSHIDIYTSVTKYIGGNRCIGTKWSFVDIYCIHEPIYILIYTYNVGT